jgi:hypothetical protein
MATPAGRQEIHFHIERPMKRFRTLPYALDFDRGFVNAVLRERESSEEQSSHGDTGTVPLQFTKDPRRSDFMGVYCPKCKMTLLCNS